jgi:hypothetical protein
MAEIFVPEQVAIGLDGVERDPEAAAVIVRPPSSRFR